VTGCRAAL